MSPTTLPQVYYNSRGRYSFILLLCGLFVLLGIWLIRSDGGTNYWAGWASVVFFGLGVVVCGRQLLDTSPRLTLDRGGITDRTLKVGEIAWADITGAYLQSIRSNYFICLELRNTADYLARLSPTMRRLTGANEALGFTPLSLNLSGVKADPPALLATVRQLAGLPPI